MKLPRWIQWLVRVTAPADEVDDILGDLEEAHRRRERGGGTIATRLRTAAEALDVARALVLARWNGRGVPIPGFSLLDFKLGARMLVRYPGLTIVGGLALAFAIWVGAATFEFVSQVVRPTLPFADGDRIVGIRLFDATTSRPESRVLHDLRTWRTDLDAVEELGAFRNLRRNLLVGEEGGGEPVQMAQISASAFRIAQVPPAFGRTLVADDQREGAPAVAVVGHDLWQTRLAGDPDVVGRVVRLGDRLTTIVGVMPPGFGFPISHSLWVPLPDSYLDVSRWEGPGVFVFGRLAPGFELEDARAEFDVWVRGRSFDGSDGERRPRPEILPYARSILPVTLADQVGLVSVNAMVGLLLVLVCSNVGLLMFARAATRDSELVVRSALGASRRRIVGQLFAEALVLGLVAATVGLLAAGVGIRWVFGFVRDGALGGDPLPFWLRDHLSVSTVLYCGLLTLLVAAIAGAVPGLKVTGRRLRRRLQSTGPGSGGIRIGGIWTAVIVSQLAATLAFPLTNHLVRRDAAQIRLADIGFPDHEYLAARLEMDVDAVSTVTDPGTPSFLARYGAALTELRRRLEAEPGIRSVAFAEALPRMYHPHRRIEVDGPAAPPPEPELGHRVGGSVVAAGFFDALQAPLLQGRDFTSADLSEEARTVIVNESFVERVLGGRYPIGRRFRYLYLEESGPTWTDEEPPAPWYEIVGVVPDRGIAVEPDPKQAGIYHPTALHGTYPLTAAVHVHGDPRAAVARLRELAAGTDPTLQLHEVMPLSEVVQTELRFYAFWNRATAVASMIALVLSLAGIYSVMSFAVARRTREVGIRVALGASRVRIVLAILRRPIHQVGFGILAGFVLAGGLAWTASSGGFTASGVLLLSGYSLLMTVVCLTACVVPARRALAVEPTEALRAEG